jgi:hypothetical protein
MIRPLKALLLGSVAAAVGAGVYRMVTFGTGWNFSLVAILVGYMVGGAVRTGSGERGGRFYQFLAAFLTYSALVGMFLPETWRALTSSPEKREQKKEVAAKKAAGEAQADRQPKPDTKSAEHAAGAVAKAEAGHVAEAQAKAAPGKAELRINPDGTGEDLESHSMLYLVCMLVIALAALVGLIYSIPIVIGFHSPISLFIFGVALWQAWRMNFGGEGPVTGPYRVRA